MHTKRSTNSWPARFNYSMAKSQEATPGYLLYVVLDELHRGHRIVKEPLRFGLAEGGHLEAFPVRLGLLEVLEGHGLDVVDHVGQFLRNFLKKNLLKLMIELETDCK